ncbi:MAG: hypothetical protein AUH85_04800 [Chloroflexi bacterium 13_1_40CM_4_68_4]|nr:MAG: hypothetical protein AUH85_04800 [Chloroflexi bacterium 13_1_40CM_4_68_4]
MTASNIGAGLPECAAVRTAAPPYLAPLVDRLEAYQKEAALDGFLLGTGQKLVADRGIHARYRDLNDGALLLRALERDDRVHARALLGPHFSAALLDASDRLRAVQRDVTAELDDARLTHGQLLAAWRRAPSAAARERAAAATDEVLRRLTGEQQRWLEEYGKVRRALGFETQAALIRALHPDVDAWLAHARRWLDGTRDDFVGRWRRWRERDGLERARLLDSRLVANFIPLPNGATSAPEAIRATATTWGFRDAAERIPIDTDVRPGKSPTAFCSRIDPPRDVRVSFQESGVVTDHVTLLHEFGHALHFAVGPDRPFDLFGDYPAITEAFGLTFERAAATTEWFERFVGVRLDEDSRERVAFDEEAVWRLIAASALYEFAVHEERVEPAREYVAVFSREFDVAVSPLDAYTRLQSYLSSRPFYPLLYHQAFSMTDGMWRDLADASGERWFLSDAVRDRLVQRFRLSCEVDLPEWLATRVCRRESA